MSPREPREDGRTLESRSNPQQPPLREFPFRAMGSPCRLSLYGERADAVAEEVLAELGRFEAKYSRYRDDSVVSEINAGAGSGRSVRVDDETAALLDYADTANRQSRGLFDISSGILRQAWDFRSGKLPEPGRVEALLARVGWRRCRWQRPRIALPEPGMELDFGGFGKEYAADRAAALCRARGVRHGLVDLGGDLAVVGPHPDGSPWLVGIRHPRAPERALATVALAAGGLATSGDYERCMVVDGRRYAHILDPRTGWPVEAGPQAVSCTGPQCLVAGTGTTVAMLEGAGAAGWLRALGLPHLLVDAGGTVGGTLVLRSELAAYLPDSDGSPPDAAGYRPRSTTSSGSQPASSSGGTAAPASAMSSKPVR